MNIYGENKLVDRKRGRILYKSNVIKNTQYDWLKQLLSKNEDNSIDFENIKILTDEQKSFFDSDLFKDLYKIASNEWNIEKIKDDEEELICSLCGEKGTKKKYFIKNNLTNESLNIGSTCINNFRDIKGTNGKSKYEMEKEYRIQSRRNRLNEKYPGIIQKIDGWNKRWNEIPTIVSFEKEEKYEKIHIELQKVYNKFTKSNKFEEELLEKINKFVQEGDKIINEVYEDIKKKQNNEWYINKGIKEWCLNNSNENEVLIGFLQKDGEIKPKSLPRIYEKNFIDKVVNKFKVRFEKSDLQIKNFVEKDKSLIVNIKDLKNLYNSRIDLSCPYREFATEYCDEIYSTETKENILVKDFVLKNSKIVKNVTSIETSLENLKSKLKNNPYIILEYDIDYNQLVFRNGIDKVSIVELEEFLNNSIEYIFKDKLSEEEINKINSNIKQKCKDMTTEEYKDMIERRKIADSALKTNYSNFV